MIIKEKNFVSAVIYVHNAENRITDFLKTIINVLEQNFEQSEIICVDDDSIDNSVRKIKEISKIATETTVSILHMSFFHGTEGAMNAGDDLAIGDFVLEFDNTILDFEPEEIMRIYRKALEGYDIVRASVNKKQKITSNIFYHFYNKYSASSYKMGTESFRILSRRVMNRVGDMNKAIPYRKAIYANCGMNTIDLKYEPIAPSIGLTDKLERKYQKHLAADTLLVFTEVGYHFSVAMTALMMIIAILMVIYSLFNYFYGNADASWTIAILFQSVAFFGFFSILTVILKYLQILMELIFKRKRYTFESIEKITKK